MTFSALAALSPLALRQLERQDEQHQPAQGPGAGDMHLGSLVPTPFPPVIALLRQMGWL